MSQSVSISVIVPCLNAAGTIRTALDSLVAAFAGQDDQLQEIIIVDGGSVDGTVAHVTARRAHVQKLKIIQQASTGLAAARNEGIRLAAGTLIGFCDADDAWTPQSVVLRHDGLLTQPACWAATGHVRFVAVNDETWGEPARRSAGSIHPGFTPGAMLIRREAFETVGSFEETLRIGADSDWILRAMQVLGPPVMVPQVVLEKGLRPGSLSTDVVTYRAEMMLIARRFIERARGGGTA